MNTSSRLLAESVFLNLPFDAAYRPLLVALLAGLTALGFDPHCVPEVPSGGQNRLDRIYALIESCGASIHDLSRVSRSGPLRVPRFNMPFELGLAYGIAQRQSHSFFVLEERSHRLQASLSDLAFATLKSLTRKLSRAVAKLEHDQGVRHPFHPYIFRQAVDAAVRLAHAEGVIG